MSGTLYTVVLYKNKQLPNFFQILSLMFSFVFIAVGPADGDIKCGETAYHNYNLYVSGDCGATITRIKKKVWGAVANPINKTADVNVHLDAGEELPASIKIIASPDAENGSKAYSSISIESYTLDNKACNVKNFSKTASIESIVVCGIAEEEGSSVNQGDRNDNDMKGITHIRP